MVGFVVYCVIIIIVNTYAEHIPADNPIIEFVRADSKKIWAKTKYTVVKDRPLNIFLKKFYPSSIRCYDFRLKNFEKHEVFFENFSLDPVVADYIITIPKVTYAMSTSWACQILTQNATSLSYLVNTQNDEAFNLYFSVHVKGAGAASVSVNVNNLELKPVISDQWTTNFDGEVIYNYLENELVDFMCTVPSGAISLRYFNANDDLLLESTELFNKAAEFRSLLTYANNNSYIECVYNSTDPNEESIYRTTFMYNNLESEQRDDITVTVNGLKLVPRLTKSTNATKYKFNYRFVFGETFNISCEKNNKEGAALRYKYDSEVLKEVEEESYLSVLIKLKFTREKKFSCLYRDSEGLYIYADVILLPEQFNADLRIRGLNEKNIDYRFTRDRNTFAMSYQYTVNETLLLSCVSIMNNMKANLNWIIGNEIINFELDESPLPQTVDYNFALDVKHNGSSIECRKMNSGVIETAVVVGLHLKPEYLDISGLDDGRNVHPMIIVGSCVGAVVLIISTVCGLCWYNRARQKMIENHYENLSNQNESPIPAFPSQWENEYDDYNKILEGVMQDNRIYPDSRKLATTSTGYSDALNEAHYTEIDDYLIHKPTGQNNASIEHSNNNYDKLRHSNPNDNNFSHSNTSGNNDSHNTISSTGEIVPRKSINDWNKFGRNNSLYHNNCSKMVYNVNSIYCSGHPETNQNGEPTCRDILTPKRNNYETVSPASRSDVCDAN